MYLSKVVNDILVKTFNFAKEINSEYMTPEHLLYVALDEESLKNAILECGGNTLELKNNLKNYIDEYINKVNNIDPEESFGVKNLIFIATQQATFSESEIVHLEHIIASLYSLENSYAVYFLENQGLTKGELLFRLCHKSIEDNKDYKEEKSKDSKNNIDIEKYSTNLTKLVKEQNKDPFIGREDIIDRTIQILSRRTKNNPIHVGEAGVGKTAITLGLARLISEGKVPKKLQDAEIFSIDIGSILAGTKYRGDFEERMKGLLEAIKEHNNPIVYIDEIHTIVGTGALNGGALDGASLLKSYLLEGKIKFIGSTTYDEYKKHIEKDKALTRRFQPIEVKETTVNESVEILQGLKKNFEEYHNVKYTNEALIAAVNLSDKYINDRFLPDKAIDIVDEAGAYVSMKNNDNILKKIDENTIEEIISKVCNIPKQTVESNEINSLKNLEKILKENIYGQDLAVEEVSRCIKMSRAGLNDDNKPVASMLFVGPTGVGKTEIAKMLAKTLGVDLIRFDMSEYTEKHSASKLIGTPPGYVGYEEGGMLTDAIRKKPNSVLLLDEIEKAHSDILNVLLQVMDYATLTDNQGSKADFRNIIIIMTSNAGAKDIGKSLVGFGRREVTFDAINEEVKKVFTPEFRNRLDKIITFNYINEEMAKSIVKKELRKFKEKLLKKNVQIEFSKECIEHLAESGISREFGAREIIRIINTSLKPLLVDEILFGKLSNGGIVSVTINNDKFKLVIM